MLTAIELSDAGFVTIDYNLFTAYRLTTLNDIVISITLLDTAAWVTNNANIILSMNGVDLVTSRNPNRSRLYTGGCTSWDNLLEIIDNLINETIQE